MQQLLRQHAQAIFAAGVRAVDPAAAMKRSLRRDGNRLMIGGVEHDLDACRHIYVVGGGKAGAAMAQAVEEILGDRISAGWVNVKYQHLAPTRIVTIHEAGHPVPDDAGMRGAHEIINLLGRAEADDLVLCLISGGGSALLPAPAPGITLTEKQAVTRLLLGCGATIHEINAIRKHISAVKGGQFVRLASPATVIALILSDVVGDALDTIASGLTAPDSTTFRDCWAILEHYALLDQIPASVRARLSAGVNGAIPDTPKPGDSMFARTRHVIIANNAIAAQAAVEQARALGYHAMLLSACIEGETKDVAKVHAAILKEICRSGNPLPRPACVISGGETTVTMPENGNGLGGRNQEFALAAAREIAGMKGVLAFSAGTDGTDGPTDAAGAFADGETFRRARELSLDPVVYLQEHHAYRVFDALGDLLKTGPTNTNVMDLRIVLAGAETVRPERSS